MDGEPRLAAKWIYSCIKESSMDQLLWLRDQAQKLHHNLVKAEADLDQEAMDALNIANELQGRIDKLERSA
jgi:hypothetical protein